MTDVVPLHPDPRGRVRPAPVVALPAAAKATRRAAEQESGLLDGRDSVDYGEYAAPGVDRREIRKLKRGEYVAADRCDLHGATKAAAVTRVKQFVERSRHAQHRCICVVHGRGLHSTDHTPVLKISVREFLRSDPSVLAYADAPASDGGSGAVYVLLRR